jgi:hypothetical protein
MNIRTMASVNSLLTWELEKTQRFMREIQECERELNDRAHYTVVAERLRALTHAVLVASLVVEDEWGQGTYARFDRSPDTVLSRELVNISFYLRSVAAPLLDNGWFSRMQREHTDTGLAHLRTLHELTVMAILDQAKADLAEVTEGDVRKLVEKADELAAERWVF